MYKSIVDFFETGKDKTVHWFARFQDIFFGIILLAGGIILLSFGVVSLFAEKYTVAGIVFTLAGILFLTMFIFARKKKLHESGLAYASTAALACIIIVMLYTGNIENVFFANLLSVIFPFSCVLFNLKRGGLASITMLLVCLVSGLTIGYPPFLQIAFFLAGIFILIATCGFIIITDELVDFSDTKISDIQKKTDIKNEFIAQLSYQIRTPLNNMIAIGGLLMETQLSNRQRDLMETFLASANNLANVINVFSAQVSSLEIGSKPNNVAFSLQSLMNSTVQLFVGQSEEYNIALMSNVDVPQYIFEGDPIIIKQIFLNLIDAIIKNKKSDKINIFILYRISQVTEQLYDVMFEIKVSDRLFFDSKQDWGKTEMINYAISSQMIFNMSGNKLTSKYENNYTIINFTLSFKKTNEEQLIKEATTKVYENVESKDKLSSVNDVSKIDLKEANVLLVEDNLINQKIVILSIQKLVKSITVANNGQEAVEKFKTSKHDIILMDIQMPIMDGIQATKKIREIELEKRVIPTPIIAITANALAGDRENCLASGMDEYISKPFQVETLVNKMKNLLTIGS